jgi:galactosamine-6-phosphate isomerase
LNSKEKNMKVRIFETALDLDRAAAQEIADLLKQKPDAVICMASGNSPRGACEQLAILAHEQGVNTDQFFFIGLDEWVGVPSELRGSCHYDFQERIFDPLNLDSSRYHLFNALAADLQQECQSMDELIAAKGGIDLMIVGIGMNGHIGFNEPGSSFELKAHVRELDEITASVGQKYFDQPMELKFGITLGFEHLLSARKVLLMANGNAKAAVVQQAAEGPVTDSFPASVMQLHEQGLIMVDAAAGALLKP